MEMTQCNQYILSGHWLATPGTGITLEVQYWSLLLENLSPCNSHSQVILGEWRSILLSPCISSIPSTMATFPWAHWTVIKIAGKRDWLLSTQQVISLFDYWGSPLMRSHLVSVNKKHKYLHLLCSHGAVHLYTSPSIVFPTNFLITLLPSPWPPSQTTGFIPWISIDWSMRTFFHLNKLYNHVHHLNIPLCDDFSSPLSFGDVPQRDCTLQLFTFR